MKKGIFCLSFDVEGIWGRKHLSNYADFLPLIDQEQNVIQTLSHLFEKHSVCATWAVVGALFAQYSSLLNSLQRSNHEIASHSFTHQNFQNISDVQAEKEIKQSVLAAAKLKMKLSSFVFPYNAIEHLDVLKRNGYCAFRGVLQGDIRNTKGFLFPRSYAVQKQAGLTDIRGSLYFPSKRALGRFIPEGMRFGQAKRGLDHAAASGGVFHLWSHPIDFIDASGGLMNEFTHVISYASALRKQGKLEILTMAQINKRRQ